MKVIVCLLALIAVSSAAVIGWMNKPSFCKNHDCPKFKVLESNDKYEVRQYETSYWVSTMEEANDYWDGEIEIYQAFHRLFGYITGENRDNMNMPMTAPVIKYHMKDQVVMAFMIPFKLYGKAPEPTGDKVTLFTSQPHTVYVKKFNGAGYSPESLYPNMLEELKSDLAADGIVLNTDNFYTAGYDGPEGRSIEKHYEIWIPKP